MSASKHEIIATEQAPKAIGPYSQAVRLGSLIFCSLYGKFYSLSCNFGSGYSARL